MLSAQKEKNSFQETITQEKSDKAGYQTCLSSYLENSKIYLVYNIKI